MEPIGSHNRDRFNAPEVVRDYQRATGLTPCEDALFARHVAAGARVLDLGVGTGRTTPWLVARGSRYVGIDCAPAMVDAAREAHPGADLRVGDAADLQGMADASFDTIVFSFNGIDYLADHDRGRCLDECRRVLAPDGVLLFSTHDPRAVVVSPPGAGSLLRRRAVALVGSGRRAARLLPNAAFWQGSGWVLDPVRGGLRTHMATPSRVRTEMAGHGFAVLEVLPGDHPRRPRPFRTPWWYFACRPVG